MNARILAVTTVLLLTLSPAWADDAGFEALVAELKAMSREDRNAALKAMSPEERRGLWFEVKKSDLGDNPAASGERGFYDDALTRTERDQRRPAPGTRAVGTITYDDGMIGTTFGGGAIIGNRFNTHTGIPVLANGTVSTIVAVVVQGPAFASTSAGFVLEGPQTTGGGAMALFSTFTGAGGLTGTTDTVTFTGMGVNYPGSSFMALFGDFANVYVPAFGTGTVNGQGAHGLVGYTGGMGPNITGTFDFGGALNGLIRAGGNILPVELIEYGVE